MITNMEERYWATEKGWESFLDSITTVSVEDRPCPAAHASLLETSRIMS